MTVNIYPLELYDGVERTPHTRSISWSEQPNSSSVSGICWTSQGMSYNNSAMLPPLKYSCVCCQFVSPSRGSVEEMMVHLAHDKIHDQRAERPPVDALVVVLDTIVIAVIGREELRSGVGKSRENVLVDVEVDRSIRSEEFGATIVRNDTVAVLIDENVLRLQVVVHDAQLV